MGSRHRLTISDYAVVALCPSLIVLLLSSLVYFVILCVYRGEYSARLGYVWFMFILGAVNIARLSIEQSRGYATAYAAVLGIATFFVLGRFQTFNGTGAAIAPLVNLMLIGAIWFLADRITYDCTLIDDDEDASGQGLLDGLSSSEADGAVPAGSAPVLATDAGPNTTETSSTARPKRRKRKHQPGRTVLWLTAAALPIFGLGQAFLRSDPALHRSALFALSIYLFATLSLLVSTSFLGVRRYLRQRGVEMPSDVSTAWLGGGILTTVIILLLCFALPKPGQMLANLELPSGLESPDWLKPSRYGWGAEGVKSDSESGVGEGEPAARGGTAEPTGDEGQRSEAGTDNGGQSQAESGQQQGGQSGDQKSGASGDGSEQGQSDQSGKGDQSGTGDQSAKNNQSGKDDQSSQTAKSEANDSSQSRDPSQQSDATRSQADQAQPDTPRPPPPPASSPSRSWLPSLTSLLKLIVYLVLLAIVLAYLWFNRAAILALWSRISQWLRGERSERPSVALAALEPGLSDPPPRPFASFRNPLRGDVDPRRAVIETFQATEAWYRERGVPRRSDETPQEYTDRLTKTTTADKAELARLAEAYNRIVYGGGSAKEDDLRSVRTIWQSFQNSN